MVDPQNSTYPGWGSNTDVATSTQSTEWPCELYDENAFFKEKEKQRPDPVKYRLIDQLRLGNEPLSFIRSPKQFRHAVCRI